MTSLNEILNFGRTTFIFLLMLLIGDLCYVILHWLYIDHDDEPLHGILSAVGNPEYFNDLAFSIERDRGYAETYQYLKLAWASVLSFCLFARERQALYFFWAILFFYLLLDDFGQLHERLGSRLNVEMDYASMYGLRAHDFGELTFIGVIAAAFLIGGIAAYKYSAVSARKISMILLGMTLALAFFGVVVDMLNIAIKPEAQKMALLSTTFLPGAIEDGGEMIVVSVMCWFVYALLSKSYSSPAITRTT